jgi:hypothetical protein
LFVSALQSADAINGAEFPADLRQRMIAAQFFTAVFYGLKIFCCKTVQLSVTQRECRTVELPSIRNGARHCENVRKNSVLN